MNLARLRSRQLAVNVVELVVVVLLVAPFVVYAAPQIVGASQSYVVVSDSMAPAIHAGDVVIVDAVDATRIEPGDVITFREGGRETPTTHRVVEVVRAEGRLAFRTKGDANEDPDREPVPADRVIGRVMLVLPSLGRLINYAGSVYGFAALVVAPFGLLVVTEVWSVVKASRADESHMKDEQPPDESSPSTPERVDAASILDDQSGYAFARADLTLTAIALAVLALYSGWMAYDDPGTWTVMAAVAAFGGFLFVAVLALLGGGATDDGSPSVPVASGNENDELGHETDRVVAATPSPELRTAPRAEVDSLARLVEMAAIDDRWVIESSGTDEYLLFDGSVAYVHRPDDERSAFDGESAPSTTGELPDDDGDDADLELIFEGDRRRDD